MKKVLLIGGTGAMGVYLTPELLKMGYRVDVVSLDEMTSDNPNLTYTTMNCMDDAILAELLKNKYDAIVDFLIYPDTENTFGQRMKLFLDNTDHYVYLSSYRIYADEEHPIKETSPRLLEAATDPVFRATLPSEYSLYKAVGEDMLRSSGYKNWTIVRPAITYSQRRFQLTVLEANILITRMRAGKTVILPEGAMEKQATMSWAGDVGKMLAAIVLNPKAMGEAYTLATAEHHTWREIADIYAEIGGLKYLVVPTETFLDIVCPVTPYTKYQLEYDRLYDRIIDNSKILELAGMKQEELMPLRDGLKLELDSLPAEAKWWDSEVNTRMDEYLKKVGIEE